MNRPNNGLDQRSVTPTHNSCALAVMAKVPQVGSSKTRLVPPLTPDEAAILSGCFLRDTCTNIAEIRREGVEGVVVFTPAGGEASLETLLPKSFTLLLQKGDSLGDRLFNAAEDLFQQGFASLCLINSDSPTLPQKHLRTAVSELERPGDRVVLGGALDGGYYLIGLKANHPRLFSNIEWSTERVLKQTIERAAEMNLEVVQLPDWYDVDDPATLRSLCEELIDSNGKLIGVSDAVPFHAAHTRNYLKSLLETVDGRERLYNHR